MNGWISIHRSITNNSLYFSEVFTQTQAWIDLIILANYTAGVTMIRGNRVEYQIGEIVISQDSLAVRWKWSRKKVKSYLDYLETERQIYIRKTSVIQIVGVVNYEKYQNKNRQKNDSPIYNDRIKRNKINLSELFKINN